MLRPALPGMKRVSTLILDQPQGNSNHNPETKGNQLPGAANSRDVVGALLDWQDHDQESFAFRSPTHPQ
jgi:hypothetical protein